MLYFSIELNHRVFREKELFAFGYDSSFYTSNRLVINTLHMLSFEKVAMTEVEVVCNNIGGTGAN